MYLDKGDGFSEHDSTGVGVTLDDLKNGYKFTTDPEIYLKKIRIDLKTNILFAENLTTEIKFIEKNTTKPLSFSTNSTLNHENKYIFLKNTPQIIISINGKIEFVNIYLSGTASPSEVINKILSIHSTILNKKILH